MRPWIPFLIALLLALGLGYYFTEVHRDWWMAVSAGVLFGIGLGGLFFTTPRRVR
jgi:hypothetical protein